jgi:F0F1-type ATP synthase membrane subunit b/b'
MMLLSGDAAHGGGFLDSLPDPMTPTLIEVGFVIALLVFLHFFMKHVFFGPVGKFMDDREEEMHSGAAIKFEIAKSINLGQIVYAEKLRGVRTKASKHRKALLDAATEERIRLVNKARHDAKSLRKDAADILIAQRETAKSELIAQVDALANSMVQHLLRQA